MGIVKNIIFDLGGVLYTLDYDSMWEGFSRKCGNDVAHIRNAIHESGLYSYECGEISSEEFFLNLRCRLGCSMSFPELRYLWNRLLVRCEEMFHFAESLKLHAEIFVLSNTNEINAEVLDTDLKSLTPKVMYSFRVGCMKPDLRIYTMAIEQWGILPEESLFVDDSQQNCEGARQAGIDAHHFIDFPALCGFLQSRGVIPE